MPHSSFMSKSAMDARRLAAQKRIEAEAAFQASRPYQGYVELYTIKFGMQSLQDTLRRLGLWGNDTVHGMRKAGIR